MRHYVSKPGGIIESASLVEWATWLEEMVDDKQAPHGRPFLDGGRRVAWTDFEENGGGSVSTIFLGMDHGYGSGSPVLFETMIKHNVTGEWDEQWRYCTHEEALKGHEFAVRVARGLAKVGDTSDV